jgi:hypothetical protein
VNRAGLIVAAGAAVVIAVLTAAILLAGLDHGVDLPMAEPESVTGASPTWNTSGTTSTSPEPPAQPSGASTVAPRPVPPMIDADGCDRRYGSPSQCIPKTFPAGTTDKCRWLFDRGYGALPVHGEDRHGLDANRDGTACGPGD